MFQKKFDLVSLLHITSDVPKVFVIFLNNESQKFNFFFRINLQSYFE